MDRRTDVQQLMRPPGGEGCIKPPISSDRQLSRQPVILYPIIIARPQVKLVRPSIYTQHSGIVSKRLNIS